MSARWRAAAVLLFCGCHTADLPQEPSPPARGIRIVSGANVTDSIEAMLTQALVVEVRDSTGRLAPVGTVVRYSGVQRPRSADYEAQVRNPGAGDMQFAPIAGGATDAAGLSSISVRLGLVTGPARIAILAPTLGVSDTARYTIVPGAAASTSVVPGDTAIYVGRSYTLRGGVIDRAANVRSDPLTWTVSAPGVTVTAAGVVTGSATGRYMLLGRVNPSLAVGLHVTVIPQETLVAALGTHIVSTELDGSNQRTLAPVTSPDVGANPRWIPGTNKVLYAHLDGLLRLIFSVDETGSVRRLFATALPDVAQQIDPAPSANGQWLYFSALDSQCSAIYYCLYRSRIDGSAPERLWQSIGPGIDTWRPSPSPDGSKVAFVTNNSSTIKVLDVATRSVSAWEVAGHYPRWSPVGQQIAFIEPLGLLMIVNADGTGLRALNTTYSFNPQPLGWSIDGRWIVLRSEFGVELIDTGTGDVLPVRQLGNIIAPSFK